MTIKRKLFTLVIIPTLALFFFSISHILDTNKSLHKQENILQSLNLIKVTSSILHELQYQRGLSSSYLNTHEEVFAQLLKEQEVNTKDAMQVFFETFSKLDKGFLSTFNKEMIIHIKKDQKFFIETQKKILILDISTGDSFDLFTHINSDLVKVINSLKVYSSNDTTYRDIQSLKLLISFREYAGQERALVAMRGENNFSDKYLKLFYNVLKSQKNLIDEIDYKIENLALKRSFDTITDNKTNSYMNTIREQVKSAAKEPIDIAKWIEVTSSRIDQYYDFEKILFESVYLSINEETEGLQNSLIFQITLTIATMLALLLGAYFITKSIQNSLDALNLGVNNFFDFLNFKTQNIEPIEISSNDELKKLADKINKQIMLLQLHLENDKDFIYEMTQISMLMKDGDFSERPYFEPTNPQLIELKMVFNELVSLIRDKIKEQTQEVEQINMQLSDKVYHQTIELEKQIVAITKSRDDAVAAEKSKDDFLANMSHEIRTPLNAILGFVKIMKKSITDPKNMSYLKIIDKSGNSLLTIINDILDFSKIQSGKFTITPKDINPINEFSHTSMLFASKAYEKHLIFSVYIDPNLPKEIRIDDIRVKQIFSNVLSNAIKFTPRDGTVQVRVEIKGEELVISVADSGIGIAKENLDKVFCAFEQADTTTTRKYGGTGLGLSISAKLAELMNGELTVDSVQGKGSTFTLRVPVVIVDSSTRELINLEKMKNYTFAILNSSKESAVFTALIKQYLNDLTILNVITLDKYTDEGYDVLFFIPSEEYNEDIVEAGIPAIAMLRSEQVKLASLEHVTSLYAPYDPMSVISAIEEIVVETRDKKDVAAETQTQEENEEVLFSGNILIAEDNKTNQMLLKLILMDYELDFKIANDGVEAVSMFKEEKFDLVLMDENMPNLNGLGAMAQIKEYENQNSLTHTPIIALTANALVSDVEKFLSAGMDGFVAKPIDTVILEVELSKYLKRV